MKQSKSAKKPTPNRIEYNKQVARIKKLISRAEKRGYIFDDEIKERLSKKKDTIRKRDIESLKKLTPAKLYEKSVRLDVSTGEITSGTKARAQERREVSLKSAATRRANKQAEQKFFTDQTTTTTQKDTQKKPDTIPKGQFDPSQFPDGGEVILDNFKDEYLSKYGDTKLLDHYMQELSKSADRDYTNMAGNKRRRNSSAISASNTARHDVISFITDMIAKDGKSAVGWIIQDHSGEITPLLDYILYGSDAAVIAATSSRVVSILKNYSMSKEELIDYAQNDEEYEDYDF